MEVKLSIRYSQKSSKKTRRYSETFKRKVVSDVNEGLYSASRAKQIYNIGGNTTVYKWLAKYDQGNVISGGGGKMKNSKSKTPVDLHSRIRYLEQIVSDLTIEKKILNATIDIANEIYGLDLKKNIVNPSLTESVKEKSNLSPSGK